MKKAKTKHLYALVELYVGWSDHTWTFEHYVYVPETVSKPWFRDTGVTIGEIACETYHRRCTGKHLAPPFWGVYSIAQFDGPPPKPCLIATQKDAERAAKKRNQ